MSAEPTTKEHDMNENLNLTANIPAGTVASTGDIRGIVYNRLGLAVDSHEVVADDGYSDFNLRVWTDPATNTFVQVTDQFADDDEWHEEHPVSVSWELRRIVAGEPARSDHSEPLGHNGSAVLLVDALRAIGELAA
jgi:hypothetical protein